ncbi:MAG TPA: malto-oligosyltrehalose synthase [Candidatus Limnocylindrales bacterium]|nr:malto-oligosyltrehalose synthase [Candidatus Limnocylindrales bacterium]
MTPRATYRVQLHAGFTFHDAARIVPYLERLGVSHLYTSPILQAAPGSTHGYDVIDHGRLNEELGGADGFDRLTDALRASGMGLVVDIVPNHMAIAEGNRWWWDVLEHGPASRYAGYFDVDWDPPESRLRNVILLPILADHYGRVLEAGEIRLGRRAGRIVVEHADRAFPIDPQTLGGLVADAAERAASDELAFIGSALAELPPSTAPEAELVARRQRDADVLGARLAELLESSEAAAALDAAIGEVNGDPDRLDGLLEEQNYRLALWRAASRDLGYRRFFDIDELIGLRMEDERVFTETHALILELVADHRIQGLRIDHPDGLRDPAGYFARLRAAAPDAWIVAEKILEADEALRPEWPVDGTTGYRFANLATGVMVDRSAEEPMSELWAARSDAGPEWEAIANAARAEVLSAVLGSDVNRLTDLFLAVCEANRRYRDFTRHELHHALREVAAALPVYRTYVRAGDRYVGDVDRSLIEEAVRTATDRRPDLDPDLFAFLGRILCLEEQGSLAGELAMRFQQLTPAAMAKGVEDTAFYRHHRLVALNEVGGDPGRFGAPAEEFHAAMRDARERWPAAMLALSTHDTKRSADLRARLAVVTADADAWRADVEALERAAAPHRTGPELPTDADLYLFLQAVVGAWPLDADRAAEYLAKATREAKLRTSWTDPDEAYDRAVDRLVRESFADSAFVDAVERVVGRLLDAGRRAALAQQVVQLTAPGVPDLYQGTELWDLSLVDPDNRRPVDFGLRDRLLSRCADLEARAAWAMPDDGLPKLWLVRKVLELRARRPEAFAGGYEPLAADGPRADVVVAFTRGDAVATVAARPIDRDDSAWVQTSIALPDGRWCGLDGAQHRGRVAIGDLLEAFPVNVLERVE